MEANEVETLIAVLRDKTATWNDRWDAAIVIRERNDGWLRGRDGNTRLVDDVAEIPSEWWSLSVVEALAEVASDPGDHLTQGESKTLVGEVAEALAEAWLNAGETAPPEAVSRLLPDAQEVVVSLMRNAS